MNANEKATGFKRLWKATIYSIQGLRSAWIHEEAFRMEVILAVVMIPLACWLEAGTVKRTLLVGSVVFVLIVEILNSGIEACVDRSGTEYSELAGRAKDLGSAAVFLAILLAMFIWGNILYF